MKCSYRLPTELPYKMIDNKLTFTKTSIGINKDFFLSSKFPPIFVWGVWGIMLLIAVSCIFIFGRNIPLAEDWQMVAPLTGNEPDIANWLWLQNNEHRVPLPKLILLIFLKITNGDFRSGMFLTVLTIGFLAAVFIRTFYLIRGRKTNISDAFFPIILLHIGNWENFYWSWQFTFIISVVLSLFLLIVIIQYEQLLSMRMAVVATICTISLPLCGANGLMYVMPVIPLMCYEAYMHLRSKETGANRAIGFLLSCAVLVTILTIIFYFIGYVRPAWYPPSPSILVTLKTGAKFMALGLGPIASAFWGLAICVVLALIISTAMLLIFTLFRIRGAAFRRAVGLLFVLSGNIFFAMAMGYGRGTMVPTLGLPIRYVFLAVPALVICYGSWELYGKNQLAKFVQMALFFIMVFLLYKNTIKGLSWRNYYIRGTDAVANDIKKGVSATELVDHHQQFLLHWNKRMLLEGVLQLKHSEMGIFKFVKEK